MHELHMTSITANNFRIRFKLLLQHMIISLRKVAEHTFPARCLLKQFNARTRFAKNKHAVNRAIILFTQHCTSPQIIPARKWSQHAVPQMIPTLVCQCAQDVKWSPDRTANDPRNGNGIFAANEGIEWIQDHDLQCNETGTCIYNFCVTV